MRSRKFVALAAAIVAMVAVGVRLSVRVPATDLLPRFAQIAVDVARSHVIREGDPKAAMSADVVRTSRRQALAVLTMATNDDTGDVWAFRFAGHFSANKAPAGEPFPTGTFMVIVIDIASGRLADLAIVDERPDLEKLGAVASITG